MAVAGSRAQRETSSEHDGWGARCEEWPPVWHAPGVKGLSSCYISPVCTVWWLGGEGGMI